MDEGHADHSGNAWGSVEAGTEGEAALSLSHGVAWSAVGPIEASALWRGAEEWHPEEGLLLYRQTVELTVNAGGTEHPGGALVVEAHDGGWGAGSLMGRLRWWSPRGGLELRLGPTVGLDAEGPLPGGRADAEGRLNLGPRLSVDGYLRADFWATEASLSESSLALRLRAWPHPRWEASATLGGELAVDNLATRPAAWGELRTTWWFHPLVGLTAHAGSTLSPDADPAGWAFGGVCIRGSANTVVPDRKLRARAFAYQDPLATSVEVLGSFTGWVPVPLWRNSDGTWTGEFDLPRGASEYVYLIDGGVAVPSDGDRLLDDGFGGQSAVIDTP